MNLVALLIAPAVVAMSVPADANHVLRIGIALVAAAVAFGAVIWSRMRASRVDAAQQAEQDRAEEEAVV
jgi:K(+)-stimulated pyrophosphate-energized sodium pump